MVINRKVFACLVGLACIICVHAGVVSQQMAERLATDFLNSKISQVKGSSQSLDLELVMEQSVQKKNSTVPLFYIFNYGRDNGFIIISASNETQTVLGWSNNGSFDQTNMPDGLQYLLDQYTETLKLYALGKLGGSNTKSSTKTFTGQRLLQTAEWGQDYPFNNRLPGNVITGCAATAMSIIMKYHNWPNVGQGEYSVWSNFLHQSLSTRLDTYYDWDNMPVLHTQTYSKEAVQALSDLLYDVSICMNTEFNTGQNGGSGTNSVFSAYTLPKFFKYKRCTIIQRNLYTEQAWDSILHVEIDNNRPVFYGGYAQNREYGHAFVLDGYDNNLYHFNFGWNGQGNGYYTLSNLKPSVRPDYDLSNNQMAIIHIEPDKSNRKYVFAPIFADNEFTTLSTDIKTVNKSVPFDVCIKEITALEDRTVYLALLDSNLVVKEHLATVGKLKAYKTWIFNNKSCFPQNNANPTDYIGLVSYDPYDNRTEIVDYAFGDNSQNRHVWIPAYDNTLQYHNISYDFNGNSITASLYPDEQTQAAIGVPFYVLIQPTNANYFSTTDSVSVTAADDADNLIIDTSLFEHYYLNRKVGYTILCKILSMSNNPDISLDIKVWSTTDAKHTPLNQDRKDCKTYSLSGYEIQSAVTPGIYITDDGVKVLKE